MRSGYNSTAECYIIENTHNKHHCYVPPEVWGIDAYTVCTVCRLKNSRLFVDAGITLSKQTSAVVIKFVPAARFIFPGPVIGKKTTDRLCTSCGTTQIWRRLWDNSERICGTCRQNSAPRICRFCGKENVAKCEWRTKDKMCSDNDCWNAFVSEMKLRI